MFCLYFVGEQGARLGDHQEEAGHQKRFRLAYIIFLLKFIWKLQVFFVFLTGQAFG